MPQIETIVFDFDGTLIDSSKSILAGFAGAFAAEGITPARPLSPEVIGPPMKETLALLAGTTAPEVIERLATRFKQHYDTAGYRETTVFEGVEEMLADLNRQRIPLHIATNKRLLPTLKILDHLDWRRYFLTIRALDAWTPPAKNKTEMIRRQLEEESIARPATIYVGDREEDYLAARGNDLRFALAAWGYGATPAIAGALPLQTPGDLLALIRNTR